MNIKRKNVVYVTFKKTHTHYMKQLQFYHYFIETKNLYIFALKLKKKIISKETKYFFND